MDDCIKPRPQPGERWACHELLHLRVNEARHRACYLRCEGLQRRAGPDQALAGQLVGRQVGVPHHIEVRGDLIRDLVGKRTLDGRVGCERCHVRDIPARVRHLVSGPDAQHRQRCQQAPHHDEQGRYQCPPSDPMAPLRLTCPGFTDFGAQPLELCSLALRKSVPVTGGRGGYIHGRITASCGRV